VLVDSLFLSCAVDFKNKKYGINLLDIVKFFYLALVSKEVMAIMARSQEKSCEDFQSSD